MLGRGYAMAQKADGTILKNGSDVSPGEHVTVTLGRGGFSCTVDETMEETVSPGQISINSPFTLTVAVTSMSLESICSI